MKKIAIIGGGAAGMMAAATIIENSAHEVLLIERNDSLGMKVMISGGGRCNVTTGFQDIKEVLKCYPRGKNFLKTAMFEFGPGSVFEWVEAHGVSLKVEKDMRVFPKSDDGRDVMELFEKVLEDDRSQILYKTTVLQVEKDGNRFVIKLKDGKDIIADKVILTPGGQAYRRTGSKGDGYDFAENLGHSVTDLAPSLSSYLVEEAWIKVLSGVSFENVKLKISKNDKHEFSGPILLTHRGVSGPAVFALSALAAFETVAKEDPATLSIDFCPDQSYENLTTMINDSNEINSKKQFVNTSPLPIPKSLFKQFLDIVEVNETKKCLEVSKKEINKLVERCKNTKVTLIGTTPGDEFVTAGGVTLSEVNSKTMESKLCPGLFFAGEILNIDGFTGGYNLQVAWCTGRLAGINSSL
jgi:hypothetical protein